MDREPHDAHVEQAVKAFRDCGFTLAAMQFKRPPEALAMTDVQELAAQLRARHAQYGDSALEVQAAALLIQQAEEIDRLRARLDNIRALAAKAQDVGGPDGTLAHIHGFADFASRR